MARAIFAATGLPLVGLTLSAADGFWSARTWTIDRSQPPDEFGCPLVRVIGEELRLSFNPRLAPPPKRREELRRTYDAWGSVVQAQLARLHIGIVGAGSVGSLVADALARMGIQRLTLIDYDRLQAHNRDRTLHASAADAAEGTAKVESLASAVRQVATADQFLVDTLTASVAEEDGYRRALDCDVLFSCVDRPWARSVLNFIAYAHLIPVIDGGIAVHRRQDGAMRGAEWRAHVVTHSRRCLECLGQYDPALVALDRSGLLQDPHYIERMSTDHEPRSNENVFAFSLAVASLEVLQFLLLVTAPSGVSAVGAQYYHFPSSTVDLDTAPCKLNCPYPQLEGRGEAAGHPGTGIDPAASDVRASKRRDAHERLLD